MIAIIGNTNTIYINTSQKNPLRDFKCLIVNSNKLKSRVAKIKRLRSFRLQVYLCSNRSPRILYDISQLRRSSNKLLK